ncbi:hypothetical protein [Nocardioides houyundeii]|uniref:hypothetical protein n=1 Tax=Nocardioides houyundeii TaxID=2045452 RepID=UPI000C767244|nr:hypothetical protein [Nocardioides houyundeii]
MLRTSLATSAPRILVVALSLPVVFGVWLGSLFLLPAGSPLLVLSLVPPALVVWALLRSQGLGMSGKADAPPVRDPSTVALLPLLGAPVLAFGTWVTLLLIGSALGVLQLIMPSGPPHPVADEWAAGSAILALVSAPLWWSLLRRR